MTKGKICPSQKDTFYPCWLVVKCMCNIIRWQAEECSGGKYFIQINLWFVTQYCVYSKNILFLKLVAMLNSVDYWSLMPIHIGGHPVCLFSQGSNVNGVILHWKCYKMLHLRRKNMIPKLHAPLTTRWNESP